VSQVQVGKNETPYQVRLGNNGRQVSDPTWQ